MDRAAGETTTVTGSARDGTHRGGFNGALIGQRQMRRRIVPACVLMAGLVVAVVGIRHWSSNGGRKESAPAEKVTAEHRGGTTIAGRAMFRVQVVTVTNSGPVFFVGGEVARPGRYAFTGETTLPQALLTAGGVTPYGRRGVVKIIRGDGSVEWVKWSPTQTGAVGRAVGPGETIEVPRRMF